MMPQVISVSEVRETKKIANEIDLPINVRLGIMVETPAAVQVMNELCAEGISFISFGTNDLTQYILAIDRNNSEVQYLYDEMNPAVLSALSYVIRRCKKFGVETSVCGQSGSREDMVRFLVSEGIDSISVNADAAEKISKLVQQLESENNSMPKAEEKETEPKEQEPKQVEQLEPETSVEQEPVSEQAPEENSKGKLEPIFEEISKKMLTPPEKAEQTTQDDNEYMPGEPKKADIPSLNDAIPIDSSLFSKDDESGIDNELKIE
jgi:hypothetical protein